MSIYVLTGLWSFVQVYMHKNLFITVWQANSLHTTSWQRIFDSQGIAKA